MSGRRKPPGFDLTKSDQITIVAVGAAIVVLTGFLVGLLF